MSIKDNTRLKWKYYPRALTKLIKDLWDSGQLHGPAELLFAMFSIIGRLIATIFSPLIAAILTLVHIHKAVVFEKAEQETLEQTINGLEGQKMINLVRSLDAFFPDTEEGKKLKISMMKVLDSLHNAEETVTFFENDTVSDEKKFQWITQNCASLSRRKTVFNLAELIKKVFDRLETVLTIKIDLLKSEISRFIQAQEFDDEDFLWALHAANHELTLSADQIIETRTTCEIDHFKRYSGINHAVKAGLLEQAMVAKDQEAIEKAAKYPRLSSGEETNTRCYRSIFKPAISKEVVEGYKNQVVKPK